MTDRPNGLTYADAGVDIDAGAALVEAIKPLAKPPRRRPGSRRGAGRLRRAVRPEGGGLRRPPDRGHHRRRRHQAEGGHRGEPARGRGGRPRGHVRQRHSGPGRRAAAVPRLLRHRQAGRGGRAGHRGGNRRGLPPRGLRAGGRRDGGDAGALPRWRLRPRGLLAGRPGAGDRPPPAGDAAAGRPDHRAREFGRPLQRLFPDPPRGGARPGWRGTRPRRSPPAGC